MFIYNLLWFFFSFLMTLIHEVGHALAFLLVGEKGNKKTRIGIGVEETHQLKGFFTFGKNVESGVCDMPGLTFLSPVRQIVVLLAGGLANLFVWLLSLVLFFALAYHMDFWPVIIFASLFSFWTALNGFLLWDNLICQEQDFFTDRNWIKEVINTILDQRGL